VHGVRSPLVAQKGESGNGALHLAHAPHAAPLPLKRRGLRRAKALFCQRIEEVALRLTHVQAELMLIAAETIHGIGDDHLHVVQTHGRTQRGQRRPLPGLRATVHLAVDLRRSKRDALRRAVGLARLRLCLQARAAVRAGTVYRRPGLWLRAHLT